MVKGDVLNYTDVLNAVTNTTAVIVVLGTRNKLEPTTDLSEGTKNIIKAMKEQKVEIISICLSAFLFYEEDKVPQMFRDITEEHRRQFKLVKESGLKYVAVLPPHIAGIVYFLVILCIFNVWFWFLHEQFRYDLFIISWCLLILRIHMCYQHNN